MMENKMERKVMNEKELEQVNGGGDSVILTLDGKCPSCGNIEGQIVCGIAESLTFKMECSKCKYHFKMNVGGMVLDYGW